MSSTTNFQSGDLQPQRQAGVFEFGMSSIRSDRGANLTPMSFTGSGRNERAASQNPGLLDTSSSSDSWFFSPQSQSSHQRQSSQRQPPPSTASMIGPTSTFFDAETPSHQQTDAYAQQYRDWADSFGGQRQQVQSQGHQTHRPTVTQNQPQGQYAFSAGRYVPGDASSQYSHSTAATVTQENMGTSSFSESSAGFNPQSMDVYTHFYDQVMAAEAMAPSVPSRPNVGPGSQQLYPTRPSPDSTQPSYTNTPDPAYHRPQPKHQQQQEVFPSPGQLHPGTQAQVQQPAHVPRQRAQASQPPGAMSFPVQFTQPQQYHNPSDISTHSGPQSTASQSPQSWTDDVRSAQHSPRPVQFTRATPPSAADAPPTSVKPSKSPPGQQNPTAGGSTRPQNFSVAPKADRKRKRVKKDEEGQWSNPGAQASDSESDDDGGGYSVGLAGFGIAGRAGRSGRQSSRL
ncbi:hypothetical protein H1R20_g4234, partial [Candolleomyces eurysporus]